MNGPRHDPRVDAYIDALPGWQADLCRELREVVHAADPDIEETIKRRVRPYFVLDGNVCALLAAKDHVNLFLYDGAIVPDAHGIITGGRGNKTARTIAFPRGGSAPPPGLTATPLPKPPNNTAGGSRELKEGPAASPLAEVPRP